jgi:hypothetical protein
MDNKLELILSLSFLEEDVMIDRLTEILNNAIRTKRIREKLEKEFPNITFRPNVLDGELIWIDNDGKLYNSNDSIDDDLSKLIVKRFNYLLIEEEIDELEDTLDETGITIVRNL